VCENEKQGRKSAQRQARACVNACLTHSHSSELMLLSTHLPLPRGCAYPPACTGGVHWRGAQHPCVPVSLRAAHAGAKPVHAGAKPVHTGAKPCMPCTQVQSQCTQVQSQCMQVQSLCTQAQSPARKRKASARRFKASAHRCKALHAVHAGAKPRTQPKQLQQLLSAMFHQVTHEFEAGFLPDPDDVKVRVGCRNRVARGGWWTGCACLDRCVYMCVLLTEARGAMQGKSCWSSLLALTSEGAWSA